MPNDGESTSLRRGGGLCLYLAPHPVMPSENQQPPKTTIRALPDSRFHNMFSNPTRDAWASAPGAGDPTPGD